MAIEIVYTSAQAGLKPGDKGFCIVAASKGIPPLVLQSLEQMTGYRHVYEPGSPKNPVVFSHLQLKTGESILSRIADAGLDYSGRSNKLSHLLLLNAQERAAGGPTRTLMHPDTNIKQWSGEPRHLPDRTISSEPERQGPCDTWKRVTGDAGWAAALAETARSGRGTDAYIVYREGTDCLALIDEALSLLPERERWLVTFSTFFTKAASSMKCQWRFIQKGQKEQQEIPPHANVFKLDLTTALGPAPESSLTHQARTGERPIVSNKPVSLPKVAGTAATSPPLARPASVAPAAIGRGSNISPPDMPSSGQEYALAAEMPSTKGGNVPPAFGANNAFGNDYKSTHSKSPKKKSNAAPIVLSAIAALFFGVMLGGAAMFFFTQKNAESTRLAMKESIDANDTLTAEKDALIVEKDKLIAENKKSIELLKEQLAEAHQLASNAPTSTNTTPQQADPATSKSPPSLSKEEAASDPKAEDKKPEPKRTLRLRVEKDKFKDVKKDDIHVYKDDGTEAGKWEGDEYKIEGDSLSGPTVLLKYSGQTLEKKSWSDSRSLVLNDEKGQPSEYLFFGEKPANLTEKLDVDFSSNTTQELSIVLPKQLKDGFEFVKSDLKDGWSCEFEKTKQDGKDDSKEIDNPNKLLYRDGSNTNFGINVSIDKTKPDKLTLSLNNQPSENPFKKTLPIILKSSKPVKVGDEEYDLLWQLQLNVTFQKSDPPPADAPSQEAQPK